MTLKIEFDREDDGRWIATIPDLPGVSCYSASRGEALAAVEALALHVIADRFEHGEAPAGEMSVAFEPAAA